ncbi:MAG: DNA repair protein RecN [Methylotenera sp.]|nr:DNA repair protein RecN [Methylotenera sp.]MDO9232854.1 DNA repair protein RecN [Methylotenera sp.]MDO9388903.1 DNA repair protein RecN [Methylotenera sp.]MDP2102899.1 DNA repair protein RecN [Methylotenera sp.]MDP2281366.1 DNA repair protein RecN [Methylotenera sp.]
MLQSLSIRDFVIVSQLDLEFDVGFTVLTGETGAGKSILIDALSLALGARGEGGVTRTGCDKAEISAIFSITNNAEAKQWLAQAEMASGADELLLRRVMFADGRSRAFINGATVTVAQLKELGELLVDIYSQNAHHSLLKLATQRVVLDSFAGLSALTDQVSSDYKIWHQLRQQRAEAEKNAQQYADELADLRDKVNELSQLAISSSEWEDLLQDHSRLSNGASLIAGGEQCRELLSEGELSAMRLLTQVQHKLQSLSEFDSALSETLETLDSAIIQLEETDRFLNRYLQRTELDPASLAELDSKIQSIHNISRKYRVKPDELADVLLQSKARVSELELFANDGELAQKEAQALAVYTQNAQRLSEGRKAAAAKLSAQISAEMQRLSLSGGKFEVALTAQSPTANGLEQVEFLVAGHAGVAPRPLGKVASGGELSRISLAIRVVTAKKESIPTMIFDEVDVGIGGGVAEVVGQLLKQLGEQKVGQRQVLVITHLPQVAALGQHHLRVSKSQANGQTLSTIEKLNDAERIEEIARMLGGIEITETTRQHAKEMLARY